MQTAKGRGFQGKLHVSSTLPRGDGAAAHRAVATEAGGGCMDMYASCNITKVRHTRDQPQALQKASVGSHGLCQTQRIAGT